MTRQNPQQRDRSSGDPIGITSLGAAASRWRMIATIALLPLVAIVSSGLLNPSKAEPGSLAGSWRGSGWVTFTTGKKERARCRVQYTRSSKNAYAMRASCATSSAKASQTATVYEVTKNRYRGSFYNTEYNVRGSVRVVVRGRSQSVTLSGDGASASIQLKR